MSASARDMPEAQPDPCDAMDGGDLQQQLPSANQPAGSDGGTHHDEHGTSEEGGYREQDYGGESTHPPTEPQGS